MRKADRSLYDSSGVSSNTPQDVGGDSVNIFEQCSFCDAGKGYTKPVWRCSLEDEVDFLSVLG
jgi:hypothetical protein